MWLSNNNNPSIDALAFANLPKLKSLNLANQTITNGLVAGVFSELTALEELYLGNTSLSNLPAGLFDNSPLTYIDLSDNALTAIEKNYLASHPNPENIAVINIAGNDVADGEGWEITDASWQRRGF